MAGIYALGKGRHGRAAEGWLAMNIEPHDIKIDAMRPITSSLTRAISRLLHQG